MKSIFKRLLSLVMVVMMIVSMMPTTVFAENADIADLTISTADELKAFADAVNAGNSYEGKTVVLTSDIDLKYTAVVIGTKESPFMGTFDGQGHTVANLSIYENGSDSDYFADTDDCLGLFGVINAPAVIKNVTVNNPYIVGSSYVGGIVGMGYTGTIENCHVTGEIDIKGHYMVGGINGHGYAKISNSSVIGAEGWDYNYIGATYKEADLEGDNVGGIVGHNGENNDIVGCTVKNVTVSGTRKIGGIVGIASLGSSITDCVVEGVTVETTATADYAADNGKTMSMGGLVGQYQNRDSGGTITGCTVTDLTFSNVNDVTIHAGALTGGVRGTDAAVGTTEPAITVSGNSISGVTGATVTYMEPEAPDYAVMIGEQGYDTLAEAITAAKDGDTVIILQDISFDANVASIVIDKAITIDGNGANLVFDSAASAFLIQSSGVTFKNMTITQGTQDNAFHISVDKGAWDAPAIQYSNITIENIEFKGGDYALCLIGENVTVDGCTFTGQDSHNIIVYSLKGDSKIVNNLFTASLSNNKSAILYEGGVSTTLTGDSLAAFMGGGKLIINGNKAYNKGVFFQFTNWGLVKEMEVVITNNLVDAFTNKAIAIYTETPEVASGDEFASFVVSGNAFTNVPSGRTIIKEYTGTVSVDAAGNYLGSAEPDIAALLVGDQVSCDGYYTTYVDGVLGGWTEINAGLSGSGTEEDPYMIYTVEDLIFFRDSINEGETIYNASGVYVALGADIDLADIDWSVNIGDDCNATFDGIFDGKDNTIYNLTSTETAQKSDGYICTGLFGAIYGTAAIKNLTIENATISTGDFTGNNVGILIGFAYEAKGTIENVTVRGDIKIDAPGAYGVGAIVGYDYCGKLNITNCTVSGNDGSYIKSSSGVGGVIGYCNAATISGCTVENIAISGKGLVGGIAGLALANTVVKDSAVENVDLTATKDVWVNSAAIAVGTIAANGTTVSNVTFADVTANGAQTSTLVGSTYTEKPTAVVPAVQAKVGDKYYTDLQTAIDAAADGDTITVLRDITLTGSVSIEKNITLDLGGKTITATGTTPLKIKASVTIDNGTLNYSGNDYGAICTYTDDLSLTLGEDLTVTAANDTALYLWKGTAITSAKLICESEGFAAIMTKGDKTANLTINGGEVTGALTAIYWPCDGKLTINGGTVSGATGIYFKSGALEITGGTIIGNGEQADYQYRSSGWYSTGDALVIENVGADTGYEAIEFVSITGGTFKSANANAVASYTAGNEGVEAVTGFISGGSFSSDVSAYCAEGITLAKNADGTFSAGKLPEAQIDDLGNVTIVDGNPEVEELVFNGSYYIYDLIGNTGLSTGTEPFDLQLAMKFTAKDDASSAQLNAYSEYFTDFHIQISGLKDGYIYGDGCYLAGYYKSFGAWVIIPLDGFQIEDGKAYPMITAAGFNFTYEDICSGVKEFICGIYMAPEILAANPDLEVSVSLGLSETVEDALASEFITVGEPLEYGVEELHGVVDVDGVGYDSLAAALAAAADGSVVTLLQDVKVTGKQTLTKSITIDGNGYSIIADETAVWYTTGSKPLYLKQYKTHLLGINADGITLKNVVLDCNNNAAGINVYCAQNVVFDNVSIINATKGTAALTVNGSTLTAKTALTIAGNSIAIDISNGSGVTSALGMTVEEDTVFDLGDKTVKFASVATMDVTNAVKEDGTSYFAAMDNAYYYTQAQMESRTNGYTNGLTLLDDVTLNKDLTFKGTLDLNGYDLTVNTLKVNGAATVTGEGTLTADVALTTAAATLTAPENMDVTTSLEGYRTVYEDGAYKLVQIVYVAEVNGVKCETFAEIWAAVKANSEAGIDVTVKFLSDVEFAKSEYKEFAYGTGNITFTADEPVTVTLKMDFDFVTSEDITITVDENVNFYVYDNAGGVYVYYGPGLVVNGTVSGGENWGVLYLAYGEHVITEIGKVLTGRVQLFGTELTVNGLIDTNYLLVEESTLTLDGADVDASYFTDTNNGSLRYDESEIYIINGTAVKAGKVELKHADSVLTIDLTSTLTANTFVGAGKIVIDASAFNGTAVQVITADMSGFTGTIEVISDDDTIMYVVTADGLTVMKAVATVNGKNYATLQAAINEAGEGDTVTLLCDTVVDALGVEVNKIVTIDLNNCNIESTGDVFVVTGGKLTINGNGNVTAGTDNDGTQSAIYACGGDVVINGGTYYCGKDMSSLEEAPDHTNDAIYSSSGTIYIYGGTFSADETVWLLNCKDAAYNNGEAAIIVEGGKFKGFNPFKNASEGADTNFVVDGKHATDADGDGTYEIGEHSYTAVVTAPTFEAEGYTLHECACGDSYKDTYVAAKIAVAEVNGTKYEDLQTAINAASKGDTVKLLKDAEAEDIYVGSGKTLDLNGNTLTVTGSLSASFSTTHIIDSTNGDGLLLVDKANISLNSSNKQLPLWTAEGARFVDVSFVQALDFKDKTGAANDNVAYYRFAIDELADETILDEFLANGSEDTGISIRIKATWTTESGTVTQYFTFTSEMIQNYFNYATGWNNAAFRMYLTGVEGLDISFSAEIVSAANPQATVVIASAALS